MMRGHGWTCKGARADVWGRVAESLLLLLLIMMLVVGLGGRGIQHRKRTGWIGQEGLCSRVGICIDRVIPPFEAEVLVVELRQIVAVPRGPETSRW